MSFVGCCAEKLSDTSILALPSLPRLVVTRITPLAPRTPNTAVADASLSTEIDSISLGSMSHMSRSTPSTWIRGLESTHVALPRTNISAASEPGSPEYCTVDTPESWPASTLVTELTGVRVRSSFLIEETAPVIVTFFCTP